MGDLIADGTAWLAIDPIFLVTIAHAAELEIGAVADVDLVFIGPADQAVILIGGFHGLGEELGEGLIKKRNPANIYDDHFKPTHLLPLSHLLFELPCTSIRSHGCRRSVQKT